MADICMLVEGAYPYVTGGVSSWLHALMTNLPQLSFALVHVGARPEPDRKARYRLPDNVVSFHEIFTGDFSHIKKPFMTKLRSRVNKNELEVLHQAIALARPYDRARVYKILAKPELAGLTAADLLCSSEGWDLMIWLYKMYAAHESFTNFFWTFRQTYLPILNIAEARLPKAHVYHAVSTGFCGLLGGLAKIRHGRPFLVTEHGIYTRERDIEIAQSRWLETLAEEQTAQLRRMNFFQEWWLNIYRFMERMSYDVADAVISVSGVNQQYQQTHGAAQHKLQLIPNGINIAQLDGIRLKHPTNSDHFVVGFVGRIVSIKDVKTLICALKIASQTIPHLQAYFVGPTDEEETYYQECQRLVALLNLENIICFTGPADVKAYYRRIDTLVLTSLSEGQPLVILEGNSAGIPVIATDVGACRELLLGITPEDQALGPSGLITPVASPQETANAIIKLWQDKNMRLQMGRAGQERVRRFYSQEQLYRTYLDLYQNYIGQSQREKVR